MRFAARVGEKLVARFRGDDLAFQFRVGGMGAPGADEQNELS